VLTATTATAFAKEWQSMWRVVNIDGVVAHYASDTEMRSPIALKLTGSAVVRGREELRKYWQKAYGHLTESDLELLGSSWDEGLSRLTIWWRTSDERACEIMDFGADGLIIRCETFYGA
jgi:hypothetical protein